MEKKNKGVGPNSKFGIVIVILIAVIIVLMLFLKQTDAGPIGGLPAVKDTDLTVVDKDDLNKSIELAAKEDKPSFIAFMSDSCIYCKQMQPELIEVAKDYKDKINIKIINIDRQFDVASDYPIQGTPASMVTNKEGTAYKPTLKKFQDITFAFVDDKGEYPDISMIFGAMDQGMIKDLFEDILK